MTHEEAVQTMRNLGEAFRSGLESIDKKPPDDTSSLMDGIAAYILLDLEGMYPALDSAYRRVIQDVTNAAFLMATTPKWK